MELMEVNSAPSSVEASRIGPSEGPSSASGSSPSMGISAQPVKRTISWIENAPPVDAENPQKITLESGCSRYSERSKDIRGLDGLGSVYWPPK